MPVPQPDTILNGGFETGDSSNWTMTDYVTGGGSSFVNVGPGYAHGSPNGCAFGNSGVYWNPELGNYTRIEQPIILGTRFNSIKFDWFAEQGGSSCFLKVELKTGAAWTEVYSYSLGWTGSWVNTEITRAQIVAAGVNLSAVSAIRFGVIRSA